MKLHERTMPAQRLSTDIDAAIWAVLKSHPEATYWEIMGAILDAAQGIKKYALRSERHPNEPEKRADEE